MEPDFVYVHRFNPNPSHWFWISSSARLIVMYFIQYIGLPPSNIATLECIPPALGRVKKIQCTTSECTIACYHEQKLIISSTALSPFSTATAIRGNLQVFSEKGGSLREFYDLLLLACARSNATPASSQSGRPRETCTRCDALWGLRSDAIRPVSAQHIVYLYLCTCICVHVFVY